MIELNDVRKVYGDSAEAVSQVNFEVEQGNTATLVGPSGCGKTTLLTMINRLTELTDGEIVIDGTPISEHDKIELRRNIGYVIQEIGLFDHMTVGENIGLVPDLRGWDEQRKQERIEELLELIQLPPETKDRYPESLSGGQQQRIGVARALAAEPDIMLMDEPFGALDPITREEIQDEFLEILHDVPKTTLFVTHDIEEGIYVGDQINVFTEINPGRIGRRLYIDIEKPRYPRTDFQLEYAEDIAEMKKTIRSVMGI